MGYFKTDGEYVYLDVEYAEAYIPEDLFQKVNDKIPETAIAYEYGNAFIALGIFYMRFFDSDTEPRDSKPLKTFCYPNSIETHPSSSVSKVPVDFGDETVKCRCLQYYRGDIMMNATNTRSVTNCEKFMAFLCSGRVPRALSYWDIFQAWQTNFASNDIDPGVPSVVLQGFISKICRGNDRKTEFRKIIGANPETDPHDYIAFSMNQISANSSVMSSLSFERFKEKLTSALIMSEEGLPQEESPIEKVLVM